MISNIKNYGYETTTYTLGDNKYIIERADAIAIGGGWRLADETSNQCFTSWLEQADFVHDQYGEVSVVCVAPPYDDYISDGDIYAENVQAMDDLMNHLKLTFVDYGDI